MTPEATDSPVVFGGKHEIFLDVVSCAHVHQLHEVVLHEVREELALELKLQLSSKFLMSSFHLLWSFREALISTRDGAIGLLHPNLQDPFGQNPSQLPLVIILIGDGNDLINHTTVILILMGRHEFLMKGIDGLRADATGIPRVADGPLPVGCLEVGADALGHVEELSSSRLAETLLDAIASQREVKDQGFVFRQVADIRIEHVPHRGGVLCDSSITEGPFGFPEEVAQEERLDVAQLEELADCRQGTHDGQFEGVGGLPGQPAQDGQDCLELSLRVM